MRRQALESGAVIKPPIACKSQAQKASGADSAMCAQSARRLGREATEYTRDTAEPELRANTESAECAHKQPTVCQGYMVRCRQLAIIQTCHINTAAYSIKSHRTWWSPCLMIARKVATQATMAATTLLQMELEPKDAYELEEAVGAQGPIVNVL